MVGHRCGGPSVGSRKELPAGVSGAAVGGGRGAVAAVCCGASGCSGVLQDCGGCTSTGPGHAFRVWTRLCLMSLIPL